jgi:hypothetical protein
MESVEIIKFGRTAAETNSFSLLEILDHRLPFSSFIFGVSGNSEIDTVRNSTKKTVCPIGQQG